MVTSVFITSCREINQRHRAALESFQLEEGLRIDLVVAEPLVVDPVAFAFDEHQRMYVVENRGYPDPIEGGKPTNQGIVARLEDTDHDGKYDLRVEFATGLTYPNGVLPWRGGVFVTCAPDILYLKDTNDDGIADLRKVVLTGFNDTKTAQLRISSPILGFDGWVYIAGGLNGGTITSPEHPDRLAVNYRAADGRFHPDTYEFQVTGGKSQFGLTFNSHGHRFGCSNRHPIQHVVLEPRYLQRNEYLPFSQSIQNVSAVEADARVYPISNVSITAEFIPKLIGRSHSGTFTSACGILAFNGTGLTADHNGNIFICEPAQNLVQRQLLHTDGVSFRSDLPYDGKEFLASTDTWFNPVFLQHGPEGALYLADMHRKVIDHPSYVPEEARETLDFKSGKQDGRIYRIVREHFSDAQTDVSNLIPWTSADQLVEALRSPEQWVRSTAYRLLLEGAGTSTIPSLEQCALNASLGESRIRALWLLYSLDALNLSTIESALSDQESGVREQAILLSENLCTKYPQLIDKMAISALDSNSRVRFNCALVLGSLNGQQVVPALAQIAAVDGADQWTRAAVLSGITNRLPDFLEAFRGQTASDTEAFISVMQDLGRLYGITGPITDCRVLLHDAIHHEESNWSVATVLGLAEGISTRGGINTHSKGLLFSLIGRSSQSDIQALDKFLTIASRKVLDESISTNITIKATALLGYTDHKRAGTILGKLLDSRYPPEIQIEAVTALARLDNVQSASLLTDQRTWSNFTPQMRSVVIGVLISNPILTNVLFDAIDQGLIKASDISSVARERLIKSKENTISIRAKALFKEMEEGGRMQVYKNLRKYIDQPGDANLGKTVFQNLCASCHTYAGMGGNVGPDLTGVKNQPADALLLHTLVPNYEVYPSYQAISVETSDGRVISGRLLAETENSLTLRTSSGMDESLLRSNIISLSNTGVSLMPDGLEQGMTKDELAGLIAYLKSGSQLSQVLEK